MPRRLLPVLALLAIALGTASCGEAIESDRGVAVLSAQALANVADRTTAKGGMRMSMNQTMTFSGTGTIPMTAEGIVDTKTQRGEMTLRMDLSSVPDADVLGGTEMTQHMIFDGLTLYMSSPLFSAGLPGGKTWLRLDLGKIGEQAGIDFGSLMQNGSQDPTQSLLYLKAVSGDVRRVGSETVRGDPTTHYKATIDFDRVADTVPAGDRAAVRRMMRQIARLAGTSKAPIEVWIGDDGVLRRMATTMTAGVEREHAIITQRIEFFDFGTKVDVRIPEPGETLDFGDLGGVLNGLLGAAGGAVPG